MTITYQELAAFADGELDFERQAEVERAVAADPDLERAVAAHRALRARLSTHFAPILDEPVIAASAQDRDRVAMELVVAGQRLELSGRIVDASTHNAGPVEAPVSLVGMFRSHRTRRADGALCITSH